MSLGGRVYFAALEGAEPSKRTRQLVPSARIAEEDSAEHAEWRATCFYIPPAGSYGASQGRSWPLSVPLELALCFSVA